MPNSDVYSFFTKFGRCPLIYDGREVAFSTRDKAVAFKRGGRTKGYRIRRVRVDESMQADRDLVPVVIDPDPVAYDAWIDRQRAAGLVRDAAGRWVPSNPGPAAKPK